MKRTRIYLLVGAGVLILAGIYFVRQREPWYRGHPLSYWIEPWQHKNEKPETVTAVYAEMDQSAVRWLARELYWQPSRLWADFAWFLNRMGISVGRELGNDRRPQAALALARLGKRAEPAIEALEVASGTTAGRRAMHARRAAMAALIMLGRESREKHLAALRDTSDLQKWCDELDVIALLEINRDGAFALPVLLEIAKSTNNAIVRAQAANLAGSLEPRPEVAVTLLKQAMDSPPIREMGLDRLSRLGTNASEATETVVGYLTDTNARVRWAATNSLRLINPAKAAELFGK